MYIIIDSSNQLLYTGIISGRPDDIYALFEAFESVFKENNVSHKYHWNKLSRRIKNKIKKPIVDCLNAATRVNFNVIQHRKPLSISNKVWYLNFLPSRIAQRLERWLVGKGGSIELIVDDDYNVVSGGTGTTHFIESLLRQISWRLVNKDSTIRKEDKIKTTIKQANGNILTIYASIAQKNSKWVSLVDVYLGIYTQQKDLFIKLKNTYSLDLK